jgi:hypothetical protein
MTPAGAGSPAYVATVLTLYLDLPDTPLRPSPVVHSLARNPITLRDGVHATPASSPVHALADPA